MRRYLFLLLPILVIAVALLVARRAPAAKKPIQFADARLIIEFNDTDQDVGIQAFLDGEPWKKLSIIAPDGDTLLEIEGQGQLKTLGLTELFFESEEPSLADLPLEQFLALFPEGQYRFSGQTVDGQAIQGTATFTHNIPPGPVIESPEEGAKEDPANTVVRWQAVAAPGIQIVGYEVIIESGPRNRLDVHVPDSVTQLTVPPEFLLPGTEYTLEVLAIEAGGNQTITQTFFETAK